MMRVQWLVLLVGIIALLIGLEYWRHIRKVKRRLAGRRPGVLFFAESLSRDPGDPLIRRTHETLVRHGGEDLQLVRADDDLNGMYGIDGEDIDELVLELAKHINPDAESKLGVLGGHVRTARDLVELLERLQKLQRAEG